MIDMMLTDSGIDRFATRGGSAAMRSKPVMVRSFDGAALDALCASYPDVKRILDPHRREHLRAGSLKIVRGAGQANGATGQANGAGAVNGARKAVSS
jgi:hypothetical protein